MLFFWADYIVRFSISKNKWTFFKSNIFDLIAIIPFDSLFQIFRIARTIRLIKLLKLVRIIGFTKMIQNNFSKFIKTNGFIYLVITSVVLILLSSAVYSVAENSNYADSLWWAIATTTTVGYGDISPHTEIGKFIAVVLMIVGIGLIGSITSTITSFFVNSDNDNKLDMVNSRINKIESLLNDKNKNESDNYRQLIELKILLDDEIITTEEFELKKKELLDI